MPEPVFQYYVTQAKACPRFSGSAGITGGEPFSSAKKIRSEYNVTPDYITNLVLFCMEKNVRVNIKTDGCWANMNIGEKIFEDLRLLTPSRIPEKPRLLRGCNVGYLGVSPWLRLDLSLDEYHKRSVENCEKILYEFSHDGKSDLPFFIASFDLCFPKLFTKLKEGLANRGLKVEEYNSDLLGNRVGTLTINNNMASISSVSAPAKSGRAKNLAESYALDLPQFRIASDDGQLILNICEDGWAALGENHDKRIRVKWQDKKGAPKPLSKILNELARQTAREELMLFARTLRDKARQVLRR